MIDLTLLRERSEETAARIQKKDPRFDVVELVARDKRVRELTVALDQARSEKNELARQGKSGVTDELRQKAQEVGARIKMLEAEHAVAEKSFNDLYLYCPNIIFDDVQEGGKECNKVVKTFGQKPTFDFPVKNHVELGTALGWFDFETASRISGNNFAFYKGDAVKLMYALNIFMLNNNMKHGFTPMLPPYLVNEKTLEGASNFPRFKEEVYAMEKDGLFLTPTAEVNLANVYRDTIFAQDDLPLRMTSWTSCFRREAGGYGAAERGLIRIHQFEKVELYSITKQEDSAAELDRMVACAESILQQLGLHYRISLLAAQDCSFASAKTFDIEVWMPGQGEYKEVSSASNCTDFQARRCAMRYRQDNGKIKLVHTLNASSLALPRLMVALLETYQQPDGSIVFPDVLKSVSIGI